MTCIGERVTRRPKVASMVVDVLSIVDTETGLAEDRQENNKS